MTEILEFLRYENNHHKNVLIRNYEQLETNSKNRESQKSHRRYNEEPNGSSEKYNNFKNSLYGLNNRMKGTEGRIIKFEDRTIIAP